MDAGIFLSSRRSVLSWILVPVLLSAMLYFFLFSYFKAQEESLKEKKSFIEAIPVMSEKISMADTVLASYDFGLQKSEVARKLNTQLKNMAQQSGFVINSLNIDMDTQRKPAGYSLFKVTIKGEGGFVPTTRFIDYVQLSGNLFTVNSFNMFASSIGSEQIYNTDISLYYYNLD